MSQTELNVVSPGSEVDHCDGPHAATRDDALRGMLMPDRTVAALADTFRVLGDPTRVRILDALSTGELCVCDIASLVRISESAVSHQLRLLRGMRLVRPRRAGRQVFYALDDQHIMELFRQALTHVEEPRTAATALEEPRTAATALEEPRTAATALEEPRIAATALEEPRIAATALEEPRIAATALEEDEPRRRARMEGR